MALSRGRARIRLPVTAAPPKVLTLDIGLDSFIGLDLFIGLGFLIGLDPGARNGPIPERRAREQLECFYLPSRSCPPTRPEDRV